LLDQFAFAKWHANHYIALPSHPKLLNTRYTRPLP